MAETSEHKRTKWRVPCLLWQDADTSSMRGTSHSFLWPGTNEIKFQAYDKEAKELVSDKPIREARSFISRSTQMAGPRLSSKPESSTRELRSHFQRHPHSSASLSCIDAITGWFSTLLISILTAVWAWLAFLEWQWTVVLLSSAYIHVCIPCTPLDTPTY